MDELFRIVDKVAYKTGRAARAACGLLYLANAKFWEGLEGDEGKAVEEARPMPEGEDR